MVSQSVWVGITIAVFFVGIGVSYAIFTSTYDPNTMKFHNQELFDQMVSQNPKMMANWMGSEMMSGSMMSDMQFNVDAPMTMPMIDGYYNGEKVFFVHTEVSDKNMADMMSMMINFPTLHVSDLTNISQSEMSKVYVFTNGIPGSEPYGGGPFMYQIDVFDSVPSQMRYSQFRVPHLVTWNDDSTPRILTFEDEILEAESNGELTVQKTENVVNAPMIVWKSDGVEQRASMVQRIFESMPGVDGEITNIDVDNYIVMMKLHSQNNMGMMDTKSHGGPVTDYVSLIDNLRANGATVNPEGEIEQPFFSVTGFSIQVNGASVQVFEYNSAEDAEADASLVSPDGSNIGTSMPFWVDDPHFYYKEKIIVLYVGDDPAIEELLESVLRNQFAGR